MNLQNEQHYQHSETENIGVLLANLGTPAAPQTKEVRAYLRQFLSDPRVVEAPRWLWYPILYGFVLPFRSPRTAAAYRKIWTDEGSPLLVNCRAQQRKLAGMFDGKPVKVELGMSYGAPSITDALQSLRAQNCRRIFILPLYPQYSGSTSGSVFTDAMRELSSWRAVPHARFAAAYCDDPRYIKALAQSIATHRQTHGHPDMLVFSFHGTPLKMLHEGDPYHCLCHKTARLAAAALDLRDEEWLVTFQSRFGRDVWLLPETAAEMAQLPGRGMRHIQTVCPAFSSDCLETLEEIAIENRDIFLSAGGEKFSYIPALNDAEAHINFLRDLVTDNIADWLSHVESQNAAPVRAMQKSRADQQKENQREG